MENIWAGLIHKDYLELNYTVTDDLPVIQNPFLVQVYVHSLSEKKQLAGVCGPLCISLLS